MTSSRPPRTRTLLAMCLASALALSACSASGDDEVVIGFITKQQENPFWVEMEEVAQQTADREDVELRTASGTSDVDVAGQEKAMRSMIDEGVDGIVIAPNSSQQLNSVITDARDAGIIVIAVDTPTDPVDTVDAYYSTDNAEAGRLIGEYAAAKIGREQATVATLDLAPGISSGEQRHQGFLEGFELTADSPELLASIDTEGNQAKGEAAMKQILTEDPEVNVVYTVNEEAALGAVQAMDAAEVDPDEVVLVSVDGGCAAMKSAVRDGDIDATAQQYPQNMARESVRSIAEAVRGGKQPSGYLDTGVELITDDPAPGVASEDVAFGVRNCWG